MRDMKLGAFVTSYVDPLDNCDPRRKQELMDSRMIQEDHNAMANLSPRVINKEYNAFAWQERLAMYNQSNWKRK